MSSLRSSKRARSVDKDSFGKRDKSKGEESSRFEHHTLQRNERGDDFGKRRRRSQLAGLIFMCNNRTKRDCFRYRVFGLPLAKKDLVEEIFPGMKLFLFDIERKEMYGIFEAASHGGMNLEPDAFKDSKGSYPAQVRFRLDRDCLPVPEAAFRHAINENYNNLNKFDLELTEDQVGRLSKLFRPVEPAPHLEPRLQPELHHPLLPLPVEEERLRPRPMLIQESAHHPGLTSTKYARHLVPIDSPTPITTSHVSFHRPPNTIPMPMTMPTPVPMPMLMPTSAADILDKSQMDQTDELALKYIQNNPRLLETHLNPPPPVPLPSSCQPPMGASRFEPARRWLCGFLLDYHTSLIGY